MKRHTDLLNSRLKEINDELVQDLKLNEMNIKEKSLACPALKAKWLQIYFEEQRYLNKITDVKSKLTKQYVGKFGQPGKPKYITEQEAEATSDIEGITKCINNQKDVVRYLDGIIDIMKSFGWDLKNATDLIKLECS